MRPRRRTPIAQSTPTASSRRHLLGVPIRIRRSSRPRAVRARATSERSTQSSPCSATPHGWAELLQRVFAIDVLTCPHCGGRRKLIALDTRARRSPQDPRSPLPAHRAAGARSRSRPARVRARLRRVPQRALADAGAHLTRARCRSALLPRPKTPPKLLPHATPEPRTGASHPQPAAQPSQLDREHPAQPASGQPAPAVVRLAF